MGGGKGAWRILAGGVLGVALIAAVGLASRARTPAAGGGHTRSISHDVLLEYSLLLLVALAVVVFPVAVYLFITGREERGTLPARRNWMLPVLVFTVAVSVIAVFLARYLHDHHGARNNPISRLAGLAGHGSKTAEAVRFDWGPVIAVGTLAVLALAGAAWYLVEQRRAEPKPEQVVAELDLALQRTIADLRAEPDPRTAVIAAYAQMEHALAVAGLPRTPAEAPREYLGRVLPAVGAQRPSVERLTILFERAKFSPHAIDAAMKEEAIDALESLRDDLRSAS